jgi:hypothetical protein
VTPLKIRQQLYLLFTPRIKFHDGGCNKKDEKREAQVFFREGGKEKSRKFKLSCGK